ncbi:ASKHA domain-containing protein [Desulfatitalea alkaliphila]|uniref:ASKHA domain-containing protein n=1 Tax=Desulfatitalea alkaliphila TaxID=2929485 RepID=A0AA41UK91_9BACT|nr:ASKHA domain-containing protein [Desulfatitalea alkaliphila]MCJ8502064.1 ASKHA domain-containing protein [Desulfatitalea alkaliphila]
MSNVQVTFLPNNVSIEVARGETVLRAAMAAGVHINASCGGDGTCGKCRVMVEAGSVEGETSDRISAEDREKGYRLACKTTVQGDVTIRIPVESAVDISALQRQAPRRTATVKQIGLEEIKEQGLFLPAVEKRYLELTPPDTQDHLPDVTRLVNHLRLQHDEHGLEVSLPVIRQIPSVFREQDFKVTVTLARPVRSSGKTQIIRVEPGDTTDRNYAVAMDIGTTTIYGQLVDLVSGKVVAENGDFNGQVSYGEDVITRIMFAEKPGGLETLQRVVIETVNKVLTRILKQSKIAREEISLITLAGNTTMTQLLLKVEPRHIRRAPYVPTASIYPTIRATDLGIALDDHVTALVYPQVSSYVGGDIVAGVMGSGMYRSEALTLFMDIGTNAEVVIGNKDWMACAACSAGPAFEGGGIQFGMRAAKGAIEDFSIDPETLEPMLMTIGNVRPKGICGSGLIIIVATLFEMGVIDNQGKFDRDLNTPRIRATDNIYEYVLAFADQTQIDRDITINEIDIENLIRAKGAIYSGCTTLLKEVGMQLDDVEQILLAGGFGSYVDLERAMIIGLLPEVAPEKVVYVGNSSLLGARMSALTNSVRQQVVGVTNMMTNFELSETPSYMDNYVASLFLPHTDMDRFPRLKTRLEERRALAAKIRAHGNA